ncbi:efflux RND transporter periplasmic adaptor subunit [Tamlana sp. s12]|uniref:efflux RND transporter periplasmic adaptor subunit n=1 Tax=Tamlana sp. s12 TaxID=1630406 RepID=UPI0007FF48BD|nr:efflux RND transporter periplasmic adaptor subunit [Tamlana sp. s12]OBQ57102.1 secretion protein HlyD [Tamlana sp. s12]QQY82718.1 efflux RND transporter periplasmic adaptor subunit [Tamlana sp. s12]
MKRKHTYKLILFSAFLAVVGCGKQEKKEVAQGPPPSIPVIQLTTKTVTGFKEYPTNIEGVINSDVRAKTAGYIQKVLVDEGQKVKKGQVLFKLETQALSEDAGAAKARVNVAQVEVDKLVPLVEKNIISSVQLETAKANLAQAKANYSSIAANIGYATIRSQVDGHVGRINFREGALISPNDATPLTTVSDIKEVYAFFSLNETEYLDFLEHAEGKSLEEKLSNYAEVNLILANGSLYSEKGQIQTSSGQINQNTGTVSFRAVFDNPNQLLTNGNSGKIQIPTVYENHIVIPQEATFEQQGNIMVFKLQEGNKITTAMIEVKAAIEHLYVVESGLQKGDKIVMSGVGKLRNDMAITPQEVPFEKAVKPIAKLFRN